MKLIDKSALVAEIDKLKGKVSDGSSYCNGWQHALRILELSLDTLEVKEVGVWKTIDNINLPQADKNKIYCVLSKKNKYLLARVINHPHDDELPQWKCTEFPFHRYDMCEGDKYMQIA